MVATYPEKQIMEALHPLAMSVIRQVEQEHKSSLTVSEVVHLNDLARKVERPEAAVLPVACKGLPIACGNMMLWPFTIGSSDWFLRHVDRFTHDARLSAYLIGYTLTNSRNPDAFIGLESYRDIVRRVVAWARDAYCSLSELTEAIKMLVDQPDPIDLANQSAGKDKSGEHNWDYIIGKLCERFGGTPAYWRWQEDKDFAVKACDGSTDGSAEHSPQWTANRAFYSFREYLAQKYGAGDRG